MSKDELAGVARAERIRRDALDRHVDRTAGLERGMQAARAFRLDADDLDAAPVPGRDAGDQPAAADRDQHGVESGASSSHSSPTVP